MVNYKCLRCGYSNNIKTKFIKHLNRKHICKPKLKDISRQEIYDFYFKKDEIKFETVEEPTCVLDQMTDTNGSDLDTNGSVLDTNGSDLDTNGSVLDTNGLKLQKDVTDNKIKCDFCNKLFLKKEYLEKHLKKSCKMLISFNNIYKLDINTFGQNIYKKKNSGDIYIVQTDYINNDYYKIGITNNIKKRLSSYRCGNTYEPRLHYYFPCIDIKKIDSVLKFGLHKFNVKREIFKGDIEVIKETIIKIVNKTFKINNTKCYEPDIKVGDLSSCISCDKFFYTKKELFKHYDTCEHYKSSLNKLNKIECEYCKKTFLKKEYLNKHLKKYCKEKKEHEEQEEHKEDLLKLVKLLNDKMDKQSKEMNDKVNKISKELKKANKELKKRDRQLIALQKKTGVTIGQQNNIQNNIKILAFNKTDMSHLKDKDYLKFLSHSNFCVPHMIKKLHFDPHKPENHNIYISNIKNNYVMIYDGKKWKLEDQKDVIDNMLDNSTFILEDKIEDWIKNGKKYPEIMEKFTRYIEKKENDEVLNKIKQEIKLILFNNRTLVLKDK